MQALFISGATSPAPAFALRLNTCNTENPRKITLLWFQCLFLDGAHNADFRRVLEHLGRAVPMSACRHGHLQMAGGMLLDGEEKGKEVKGLSFPAQGPQITAGNLMALRDAMNPFSGQKYRPSKTRQGSRVPWECRVAGSH